MGSVRQQVHRGHYSCQHDAITTSPRGHAYLSESFALPVAVFFLFGAGILHSIEKATQLVHGTPKLAASHRTYVRCVNDDLSSRLLDGDNQLPSQGHLHLGGRSNYLSCMAGLFG